MGCQTSRRNFGGVELGLGVPSPPPPLSTTPRSSAISACVETAMPVHSQRAAATGYGGERQSGAWFETTNYSALIIGALTIKGTPKKILFVITPTPISQKPPISPLGLAASAKASCLRALPAVSILAHHSETAEYSSWRRDEILLTLKLLKT